jgi:hypothetical protein
MREDHGAREQCPFLIPGMADHLWMYPGFAYCRRPDAGVRVPAGSTLVDFCTTSAYNGCRGYRAWADAALAAGAQETATAEPGTPRSAWP